MKTCALVLALFFIDGADERLTFVGGGCHPFQPLIGVDGRVPTRLKAEVGNASPQKRRILPPLSKAADPQNHVFIPLADYDKKIDQLFEGDHDAVFIRGGVAIGKTTLAEHLAREFPQKYVNVPFTDAGQPTAWKMGTVEALEKAIGKKITRDGLEFRNALKLARDNNLTLVYDEAHTLFSSPVLCSALFKSSTAYKPKILLFSASGDASTASTLIVSTPVEITQKYMWTPPLNSTSELQEQLKEADVRLDKKSIKFFMQFCGGHRGIFIAAMRWVQSKQRSGISPWAFRQTVGFVRNSYGGGDWDCAHTEILGYLRESRAVRVNGLYKDMRNVPREFVELLCKGSTTLPQRVQRDLTIHGFVLPKYNGTEGEFQQLDWMAEGTEYRVANPLLASYYFHNLKRKNLEVRFEPSKPQHCADLLMRALPYLLFSRVVSFEANTSELVKDGLPSEQQYNDAIFTTLKDMKYKPIATKQSRKGEGNPDIALKIGGERFVLEGVKLRGRINSHLQRFDRMENYKNAKHKGLYIIGNDTKKMRDTLKKTQAVDVQVIGLVPNIAHTAYTVHVKSKGMIINTFKVECDLVARRLVLKDDGKPELYSVQSLKSVNLSPTAQTRRWVKSCSFVCFFLCHVLVRQSYLSKTSESEHLKMDQRLPSFFTVLAGTSATTRAVWVRQLQKD
eukprot:Skav214450  [mRNA]  locus=scaffold1870:44876:46909:+ [translate_table: standard]